ncbi:MAG: leucine-rich repeat protein [Clostridia bacterium]|nr:leucine-rich repeat protein [Clostridia bacterium]
MKIRFKRAFATFLTLVMLIIIMPITRLDITANAETLGGACGQNLKWTLNVETGEFLIEGEGEMYSYEMYQKLPWYDYFPLIKFVIVKADIPGIENDWLGGGFCFCENLIAFSVDDTNTRYSTDENGVLFNKDKTFLEQYPSGNPRNTYTIPDTVKYIDWLAFGFNKNLTKISIPEGVTEITTEAFYECVNLTNVTIPNSITNINMYAFEGCNNLADVYYNGTQAQWNKINIKEGNDPLINATMHFNTTSSVIKGDTSGDNMINSTDALLCLQYSVGKITLTDDAFLAADVDGNGKVNSVDALKILQFVVGKIENL